MALSAGRRRLRYGQFLGGQRRDLCFLRWLGLLGGLLGVALRFWLDTCRRIVFACRLCDRAFWCTEYMERVSFLAITSRRKSFAWASSLPLRALATSRAALWDTLSSLPLAFAVLSGLSISSIIEYPHFGIFISPMRNQTRKSDLYGFPYQN